MSGRVYWVTWLAGAGKTTVGTRLYTHLRATAPNVIRLDGDVLRDVFKNDLGHTLEDRKKLAFQYSRLCRMLSAQGQDVVISTISMFHDVRAWNRQELCDYVEIFVDVPIDELVRRDQKGLYSGALRGEIHNVIGVDIPAELPENPDVVLKNAGDKTPDEVFADLLFAIEELP